MKMNFDDEQLMISLLQFVSGSSSVQFQLVDLYGNNKPSQLFDTTTSTTEYHVFTQLKKKKTGNGKNFNRGIVGGGGSWKGIDISKPVYDWKKSVIGFKKTFRFEENNHVWIMKEYRLCDELLNALIQHEEEFVVCRITRSVNSSSQVVPISSSQPQQTVKSFVQDLGQTSAANVIPYIQLNGISNGTNISLLTKESKLPASKEECDIATYHKELDAYAASVLETMVPYIPEPPQEYEVDSIPLFSEDFLIGYTDLWFKSWS
ncbi:hypothetical protein KY290_013724 [Solanum tuberosum]|uniref:NAC domain-containing protein n=1 Tax=Solanum tuberosum TaxID=4113 RepID=A0ABQ7VMM0_SOLTU|nr:hypothetical protein KY289_013839 [Solanum tuberosum]KAH0769743.1 hypothetical protein KY290_013724 [Solanum tuberosum]